MSKRRTRGLDREGGQATFEFALVSIGLILFVLAVIDGALLMYNYVSASNAVREAARYASVNCGLSSGCTDVLVETRAASGSGGFMQPGDFVAEWQGTAKGDSVIVRVADGYTYDFLFFPGVHFPVDSCVQMRLEQDEPPSGATSTPGASC